MASQFFLFSIHFVIGPILYQKNDFKILDVYILVKRPLEKLHLHPQWGPDTHNSPHQRGAASKAEQPLFVQKKTFQKLSKASQSLTRLNIQSLPYSLIIIFDEVKHSITDFKTFVKYFSLLNINTDRQVISLCRLIQCNIVKYKLIQCNKVYNRLVKCSIAYYSVIQCSTV